MTSPLVSEAARKLTSVFIFAHAAINHIQYVDGILKPVNDQRSALFARPKELHVAGLCLYNKIEFKPSWKNCDFEL